MALFLPVGAKPPEQAETGHWYDRAGKPCYQQTTAKGALRGTDLRDARKQGLVPSVTTVLSVLAKPALETWKVKQGILPDQCWVDMEYSSLSTLGGAIGK